MTTIKTFAPPSSGHRLAPNQQRSVLCLMMHGDDVVVEDFSRIRGQHFVTRIRATNKIVAFDLLPPGLGTCALAPGEALCRADELPPVTDIAAGSGIASSIP
jgi:hypothetical protein